MYVEYVYLDKHLKFDSEGQLRMKLYDKIDDFNYQILNFPFICTCSNISAAPTELYHSVDTIFQTLWFLSGFP
jgi:hypothetical protein